MNELYKKNNNICYSCKYHIVWCPKYRRPVLSEPVANRLKIVLQEVIDQNKSELIEIEIVEDHVHLLLECDPQLGTHRLIKKMKGVSSRILRNEFPELKSKLPCLWTNSYFISTVGGAPLSIIKQYIKNQKDL
jgi:putative transposase